MIVYQGHNSGGNHNYNAFFYDDCHWYLHFHKNYELAFVLDGQTELILGSQTFQMHPGDFALVLPYELHGYRTPEHSKVWIAVFSADFVSSFARTTENKQAVTPVFRCSQPVLDFLQHQLVFVKKQDTLMMKAALYAVCSTFLNSVTLEDAPRDINFAQQVIAFVEENFRSDITLRDLAASFGYEYHYVSRQFHRQFPLHFKQFLNIYRTEFARDQLLYTDCSITDIALQAGFQNVRSFNRAFLEQMGMTPTAFRSCNRIDRIIETKTQPIP